MFSIIRSSCWCVYFILPWVDPFEQLVSLPFSWIVIFFDYSQQLLMWMFHNSPGGFFWAGSQCFILLDRYVFDYSQQLLMCIFSSFSGWILLSRTWVSHSLGSLFFRFATLIPNVLTFMFVEWWMDVISVKWVSIQILQYRWLPWIIMKTFCVFAVLYGGKYLICPIDSLLAAMLIWMFLSFLFESCFALLTYFFLRCWRGYMVFFSFWIMM